MKAISVRQPYGWAIIHGGKDIENRTWPTNFRGRVAIHVGKQWHQCRGEDFYSDHGIMHPVTLPFGCVIGTVEIVDCVRDHVSYWAEGPWCWVLSNPTQITPFPSLGKLGFFEVDIP